MARKEMTVMTDLIQTYNQLSETQQKQLLAFANLLLLKQKAKQPVGDLTGWKEKISNVSTWSEDDIKAFEENVTHFKQWRIQDW
ncbi:hypothetical protein [Dyadobacter sp. OTU695]|uniref:hypothetical protein n=1 Tax=Dyadobacter sp. OTU695 TaxID=3043860 RepID=UPI00313E3407